MVLTSAKDSTQMTTLNAPLLPSSPQMYTAADGQIYTVYEVPTANRRAESCLGKPGRIKSTFIDPATGQEIEWQGKLRSLSPAWSLTFKFDNFATVLNDLNFPLLLKEHPDRCHLRNDRCGRLCRSVAYGFARFRFPGKNGLFLVMIMTIILPFQVLLIRIHRFQGIGAGPAPGCPLIVPHSSQCLQRVPAEAVFPDAATRVDQAAQVDARGLADPLVRDCAQAWPVIIAVGVPLLLHLERLLPPLRVPVGGIPNCHDDGGTPGVQRRCTPLWAVGLDAGGRALALIRAVAIFFVRSGVAEALSSPASRVAVG